MTRSALLLAALLGGAGLAACGDDPASDGGASHSLETPAARSVSVNETLRVPIALDNPSAASVAWELTRPALPSIDATATLTGTAQGAEFVYTPLVSHVGTHAFTIAATVSGATVSTELVVTVDAGAVSEPVFAAPGAGGTFDLGSDPCVRFDVEVIDADSEVVDLTLSDAPAGATLDQDGTKSAAFEWCPTDAQIAESLRWRIGLSAFDGDNEIVEHTYVAVLRAPVDDTCSGTPPELEITSPAKGEIVASDDGYPVTLTATDAESTPAVPTLYWTTETPANPDDPDLGRFQTVPVSADPDAGVPGAYVAELPTLGLGEDEEAIVWLIAVTTDDDDADGTACDHAARTPALRFIARPASGGVVDPGPDPEPDPTCVDDAFEDDDVFHDGRAIDDSTLAEGVACPYDDDWLLFAVDEAAIVTVDLLLDYDAYDLDLEVYDEDGEIVGYSETFGDETVEFLAETPGLFLARVYGYDGDSGPWLLALSIDPI